MGKKYPPLDRDQVETILKNLEFYPKRQKGTSHAQWEGYTKGQRRIVTVDHLKSRKKMLQELKKASGGQLGNFGVHSRSSFLRMARILSRTGGCP